MGAQIFNYLHAIRYSYWFVPSLMVLAAVALAAVTTAIDIEIGTDWPEAMMLWGLNTPAGARALLSTIAGSMITVAGVTFSITIAAVVFATGQLGPRLLANFMGDTSNQITLGTFIATFVYGLLVLRTVNGAEEGGDDIFVPHLGVLMALILSLASLGVLIYFIHHVPRSISASEVVARLGREMHARVKRLFPARLGDSPPGHGDLARVSADLPEDDGIAVPAADNGYITAIDTEALMNLAIERECILHLRHRPGDFVFKGETVITVHAATNDDSLLDDARLAVAQASERTHEQDLLFVVQQLVEIAVRALSPGVNDPYTAISSLDWLGSGISHLAQQSVPSAYRVDKDNNLRVIVPEVSFHDVATAAFDQLRPYIAGDPTAAGYMMATLERLVQQIAHPPYRAALLEQADALHASTQEALPLERDRMALAAAYARLTDTFERTQPD